MTEKDYGKLAEVLSRNKGVWKRRLVNDFVDILKADDTSFDAERFKTACIHRR